MSEGRSLREISGALRVQKETLRRWIRDGPPRRVWRYNPDLTPSPDLAYVAGFYLGDGEGAGNGHKVRFRLADSDQLGYVSGLVAKILRREPKPFTRDRSFYVVDYDSVALSDYLNQPLAILLDSLEGFESEFLQGFFDAEGYVTCNVDAKARRVRGFQIGAANTNMEYLDACKSRLAKFGLAGRIRVTNKRGQTMKVRGRTWIRRNDVYHLVLGSMSKVRIFNELVGFRNATKSQKLNDLVTMMKTKPPDNTAGSWRAIKKRVENGSEYPNRADSCLYPAGRIRADDTPVTVA